MPKPVVAGAWVYIKKLIDAESINIREVINFKSNGEVDDAESINIENTNIK